MLIADKLVHCIECIFMPYQGDIDDDEESETGIIPVQLPLSFHALRAKEKETESASFEADIKGLIMIPYPSLFSSYKSRRKLFYT